MTKGALAHSNYEPGTSTAEPLDDIVLEMGRILYENGLAIGEVLHEDGSGHLPLASYIIGPASLDRGMVLIPLHTHQIPDPLLTKYIKQGKLNFTWVNAIVVKLVKNNAPLTSQVTISEDKGSSALPPNQAIYVGLCILPLLKPKFARAGSENILSSHFERNRVQKKYLEAEQNGQPLPSTIDIVWHIL